MKGFVYSSVKEIAFVDQTPWIQNTSIKQNVLGLERFEENWYAEVMRVCELVYDARELPDGDGMFPVLSEEVSEGIRLMRNRNHSRK